jgi:hypothetical protein
MAITLDSESVVVKATVASAQIEAQRAAEEAFSLDGQVLTPPGEQPPLGEDGKAWEPEGGEAPPAGEKIPRRFHGSVDLDPARLNKQIPDIAELVVQHLVKLPGADVTVTLQIEAEVPDGVPGKVVIDVTQNTRDLKFEPSSGFEEE